MQTEGQLLILHVCLKVYSAVRGQGAYLTIGAQWGSHGGKGLKQKLPLSTARTGDPAPELGELNTTLVAVEWGNSRGDNNYEVKTAVFKKRESLIFKLQYLSKEK